MRICIDTSVLVALIDSKDKWHMPAVAIREAVKRAGAEIFYFDCVVNETITVLARRLHEQDRSDQFAPLLSQLEATVPEAKITWVAQETQRLYSEILSLVRSSSGGLNFHDALIALTCQEFGIQHIASFDRDFDQVTWLTRVETPSDLGRAISA